MIPTNSSTPRSQPSPFSVPIDLLSGPLSDILITLTTPFTPCWVLVTLKFHSLCPLTSSSWGGAW